MSMNIPHLEKVLLDNVQKKRVHGLVVNIQSADGSFNWLSAAGNMRVDDLYFLASTTKLYTTAVILKLRDQGRVDLDDPLRKFLSGEVINGIHVYKGKDYSGDITVRQLMSQTSGIADYFQQKGPQKRSLEDDLLSGKDRRWTFDDVMVEVRKMKPGFSPGAPGRALYSDTNFQLLGNIIEQVMGQSVADAYAEIIFEPLTLEKTYLYSDFSDRRPVEMYYRDQLLHIPAAMSSFGPDGGIVSSAQESMCFVKAFFQGKLFPISYLDEMKKWNRIFFPLEYGLGISRFRMPWFIPPYSNKPELIGHSGLSGAFAWYCPTKAIFLTGTVNQISNQGIAYKMNMQFINKFG